MLTNPKIYDFIRDASGEWEATNWEIGWRCGWSEVFFYLFFDKFSCFFTRLVFMTIEKFRFQEFMESPSPFYSLNCIFIAILDELLLIISSICCLSRKTLFMSHNCCLVQEKIRQQSTIKMFFLLSTHRNGQLSEMRRSWR